MTCTRLATSSENLIARVLRNSRFVALVVVAAFACAALQTAHAQSSDTWKSVAIISGSTAAGAYIGHKIAGAQARSWVPESAHQSDMRSIDVAVRMSITVKTATTGTIVRTAGTTVDRTITVDSTTMVRIPILQDRGTIDPVGRGINIRDNTEPANPQIG